jgi:hypothetical protein
MFSNYTDPTTNGSSLSTVQTGMNNYTTPMSGSTTGMSNNLTYQPATVGMQGGMAGNGQGNFLGMGPNAFGNILGTVQVLGSLWNSFQQHRIAKEQLALSRRAFETNLANNTKTYNTALEDRIRSRYHTEGRPEGQAEQYLDANRL